MKATWQHPTIGRIVRYRNKQGEEHPAIISFVGEGNSLSLHVFNGKTGNTDFARNVHFADPPDPGWSWPPRVPR